MEEILKQNPKILEKFIKLPTSHKREYINYVMEAKKETTKVKRIQKMIEMLEKKD
ncbi:MAG: YdeI/OmpD-associated family protein [Candidatus Kapaibacteriota bacterium]